MNRFQDQLLDRIVDALKVNKSVTHLQFEK